MRGYATPDSLPAVLKRRVLLIPADPDLLAAFNAVLLTLTDPANWTPVGEVSPQQAAAECEQIILAAFAGETDI